MASTALTGSSPTGLRARLTSPSALLSALLIYWALVVATFAAFPPYPQSPRLAQGLLALALIVCAWMVAKTRLRRANALADGALAVLAVCATVNAAVVATPQGQVLSGLPIVLGAMFAGWFLPAPRRRLQLAISIGGYLLALRINPLIPSLLYPLSVGVAALVAARMVSSLATRQQIQIQSLGQALDSVHTLSGLLPICTQCKRIRNDQGYWDKIEKYVSERTGALFSHGLCPNCLRRFEQDAGLSHEAPPEPTPRIQAPIAATPHKASTVNWHLPGASPLVLLAILLSLLGLLAASFALFPPSPGTPRLLIAVATLVLGALAIALILARRTEPAPLAGVAVAAYTTFAAIFAATSPTPQGQMLDALPVVLAGIFSSYFLSRRVTALQLAWGIGTFTAALVVNPLITSPLYPASVVLSAAVATVMVGTLAEQQRQRISELQEALDHVRTLSGLLPVCMYCKNVRNDEGYWDRIEEYIATRTDASFSLGLCPDCEQPVGAASAASATPQR